MTLMDFAVTFAAAFVASAINAVAGGGTFLVFPVLMMSGLGAIQANIMSTIALWPGAVASAVAYRGQIREDVRQAAAFRTFLKKAALISMVGAAVGTWLLLSTPERVFSALVPWLLLFATLIFTFGRSLHLERLGRHVVPALLLQFVIAIYGGYFGAGIGILMLAMLQLLGHTHIHQMNAVKTILGSSINGVAWCVFLFSGLVIWPLAAVMIAAALAGGYLGARAALRVSARKVRIVVSCIGFFMTAYFFLKA